LTKDAFQVAPAEENGARALPATQAVLFAEVRKVAGDLGAAADFAHRFLVGDPVDGAVSRANRAALERGQSPLHSPGQLAAFPRIQICRPAHAAMVTPEPGPRKCTSRRSFSEDALLSTRRSVRSNVPRKRSSDGAPI